MVDIDRLRDLPGVELIERGLADLQRGERTVEALLVAIGAPRLRGLGFDVESTFDHPEHALYEFARRAPRA